MTNQHNYLGMIAREDMPTFPTTSPPYIILYNSNLHTLSFRVVFREKVISNFFSKLLSVIVFVKCYFCLWQLIPNFKKKDCQCDVSTKKM